MLRNEETGQRYVKCEKCGEPIYFGNESYEADVCILIDGVYICEDCIKDYAIEHFGIKLEEDY